jgi:hypothetical protein
MLFNLVSLCVTRKGILPSAIPFTTLSSVSFLSNTNAISFSHSFALSNAFSFNAFSKWLHHNWKLLHVKKP